MAGSKHAATATVQPSLCVKHKKKLSLKQPTKTAFVATVMEIMPGCTVFEHPAVQWIPRQLVPGMTLHSLPLTDGCEEQERRKVGLDKEGWDHSGHDIANLFRRNRQQQASKRARKQASQQAAGRPVD